EEFVASAQDLPPLAWRHLGPGGLGPMSRGQGGEAVDVICVGHPAQLFAGRGVLDPESGPRCRVFPHTADEELLLHLCDDLFFQIRHVPTPGRGTTRLAGLWTALPGVRPLDTVAGGMFP